MDGDRAPLAEICNLVNESGAYLIVDEAHATGVFGERGAGLVAQLGLCDHVFARVHTFGKAIGYRGGVVVGDASLREYLINVARPFVYSTAPDLLSIELIREAYRLTLEANLERAKLSELVATVIQLRSEYPEIEFLDSDTPIQGVVVSGNREALELERRLLDCGIFARAIRSPTVPLGLERIRICLHSFNTTGEVRAALDVVAGRSAAERSALNV
jgi:8-amino-7-oxononanoate synthase